MTNIGIVVAMTAEARSLDPQVIAQPSSSSVQGGPWIEVSGIGSARARLAAQKLAEKGVEGLVSWGIAGGLKQGLSPGDLVLPEQVLAADGSLYSSDIDWHERLRALLSAHVPLHTGLLTESPAVLILPSDKLALSIKTGATAVDMESAAIAAVAYEVEVPFVAIRAISDRAERTIPRSLLSAIDDFGRPSPSGLMKGLARRPVDLFAWLGLARDFRAARASLATVVRLAGLNLLGP